ncbi:MAG: hypothetical protein AABY22_22720 [Nanoarchaeota archaeon]
MSKQKDFKRKEVGMLVGIPIIIDNSVKEIRMPEDSFELLKSTIKRYVPMINETKKKGF